MGMASLVFVPLGAGPECMGSLVLMRSDPRREWTDIECAALLDIGHDLGRAALNARTFEREHALVTELRALDVYKSQLLATVSHELKSPLTTVTGHLELLQSGVIPISTPGALLPERHRPRVEADVAGDRGPALPAQGRRAGARRSTLERGRPARARRRRPGDDLDVGDRARTSRSTSRRPTSRCCALGEPRELDKVVLNLVNNAVKYTPEHRRIHICLESYAEVVALAVTDEGIGISEEDQVSLFTEFFRSTNPEALAEPGTGLGLTIVKRIVERHGGTIQLDSVLGGGQHLHGHPAHRRSRARSERSSSPGRPRPG